MDINTLKAAGIDYCDGINRFSGNAVMYEKYLAEFFDDTTFKDLSVYLSEKNYTEAFKCAHTLKGTAGNLSMEEFYRNDCTLVEALRNKNNARVSEMYENLVPIYEKMKKAVKGE